MSRRIPNGRSFLGSLRRDYKGRLEVDGKPVGRVHYRVAFERAFARFPQPQHLPIVVARGTRGRKRALDRRRKWKGCDHEFSYHEDTIGDYVYTGTVRWLQCDHCGADRPAGYEDAPSYDDF